jgi:hypothetical protein
MLCVTQLIDTPSYTIGYLSLLLSFVTGHAKKDGSFKDEGMVRVCNSSLSCCYSSSCKDDVAEGLVEVFHNGYWGSVCVTQDDIGGATSAKNISRVVCRQLGFDDGSPSPNNTIITDTLIWLDSVSCLGNERKLENCRIKSWGVIREGCHSDNNMQHLHVNCTNARKYVCTNLSTFPFREHAWQHFPC